MQNGCNISNSLQFYFIEWKYLSLSQKFIVFSYSVILYLHYILFNRTYKLYSQLLFLFFLNDILVVIANLYANETRYIEVQSIDSKSHERESKVILIIHQF